MTSWRGLVGHASSWLCPSTGTRTASAWILAKSLPKVPVAQELHPLRHHSQIIPPPHHLFSPSPSRSPFASSSSRSHSPLAQTCREEQSLWAIGCLWTCGQTGEQSLKGLQKLNGQTGGQTRHRGRNSAASWEESWKEFWNPWKDKAWNLVSGR